MLLTPLKMEVLCVITKTKCNVFVKTLKLRLKVCTLITSVFYVKSFVTAYRGKNNNNCVNVQFFTFTNTLILLTLSHDVGRHRKRTNSDASSCSHDDRVMDQLPSPNVSASTGHIHQEIRSSASPRYLPENPTHQNALPACDCQHHNGK